MFKFLCRLIKLGIVLFIIGMAICAVGALLELIIKYWILILLTAIFVISVYYHISNKSQKKKAPKPTLTLRDLERKEGSTVVATKEEMADFLASNVLIRSFHTRIVGVTHNNDDGSSRQEILSHCLRGEPLGLIWQTFEGTPACAVISDHGQVGFLGADLAADLDADYGRDEYTLSAQISDITGGEDGLYYGCNILLSIYGPIN